ncbi:PEP-CTERM sorting domain-containing protein [Verrucomicrobiaceae bacterium 227]
MKNKTLTLGLLALGISQSGAAIVWNLGNDTPGRTAPESASIYGATHDVTFVQETAITALPGDPNSPATDQQADDDYYFAGVYTNQVDGGAAYTPVGLVTTSEIAVERAVTSGDTSLRYHFNFADSAAASDSYFVTFQMLDLDDNSTGTGAYDIDVLVNGNLIDSFTHNASTIASPFVGSGFSLADVGGTAGAPDDNYVELRVTNPGVTSARWSNVDYVQLESVPEPSTSLYLLGLAGLGFCFRRRNK